MRSRHEFGQELAAPDIEELLEFVELRLGQYSKTRQRGTLAAVERGGEPPQGAISFSGFKRLRVIGKEARIHR